VGLYNAADTERLGQIGGAAAVQFFSRSKLPIETLKSIWTASDNPPTNSLDHRKFAVAIRLIQLAQNGQKGQGPNLVEPPGVQLRPVFFEGVSGVSVPLPQQHAQPPPAQQPQQQPQQQFTPHGAAMMGNNSQTSKAHQQSIPISATPQSPSAQAKQGPESNFGQSSRPYQSASPAMSSPASMPVGGSFGPGALTVQDPYTLTPSDQARYEQIFADYSKEDGYCYGPEAVALFGKSGVPQPQLAAIWNMVDNPVDNRLDRLEFAMAMHLIVCLSKKNLPLPPSLPMPLKQLKAQQAPSHGTNIPTHPSLESKPTMQPPMPMMSQPLNQSTGEIGNVGMVTNRGTSATIAASNFSIAEPGPAPGRTNFSGPSFATGGAPTTSENGGGYGYQVAPTPEISTFQGSPPLQEPSSNLSISDAFEGLVHGSENESVSSYTAPSHAYEVSNAHDISKGISTMAPASQTMYNNPAPSTGGARTPAPVSASGAGIGHKVKHVGESSLDLEELRTAVQKLQAENISLKARLGTISEEEDDVRRELSHTVSEITKLSSELTTLRAQVLAAKTRLLEAAGELTAAKEKKRYVPTFVDSFVFFFDRKLIPSF
jgi:Cytoskeletal-regulatory complex EF hand